MKKIDFHVHTKTTKLDENTFEFDLDVLSNYINNLSIDAIAITNHNIFDKEQYDEISKNLNIIVFPGIEVSLENGHILVIAPPEKLVDFKSECEKITQIYEFNKCVSVDDFLHTFPNINKYLIIPHYLKAPAIQDSILKRLSPNIFCGEVESPKKFERCIKDNAKLTPVLFSDFRRYDFDPIPKNGKTFPVRQTFIDCDNLTIPNIKLALKDKDKVSLTPEKFKRTFQILPDGTQASTGINVIFGQRSSGKTYTLDTIQNTFKLEAIKYIKQFSLIKGNDDEEFQETIDREKSEISDEYLADFKAILCRVADIDLGKEDMGISEYISSLISFAKEQDKSDAFSKTKLFTETLIQLSDITELKNIISAVITLLESDKYRETIQKYLPNHNLKALFCELICDYKEKKLTNELIKEANNTIEAIKDQLAKKSAVTQPKDWDFVSFAKKQMIVEKFDTLINSTKDEAIICEDKAFGSYKVVGKRIPVKNVTEIKNQFHGKGKPSISKDEFSRLATPYEKIHFLISEGILNDKNDLYKIFWKISFEVLNLFGKPLSGGEKAEYNLLTKLRDSQKYDMILIDEPESSFDNLFLRSNIIQLIDDLAKKSTVFISTHNNNLGVLIKANRLLYTEKTISSNGITYRVYSGNYDEKELVSVDGNKKQNFTVLIDSMEAGESAYNERRTIYESLKNS